METAESATVETVLQIKESISVCVNQLKPYDSAVKSIVDEYKTLSIVNNQDKDGYLAVCEARKALKAKRIEVEKKTKELVGQGKVLIDEIKKEGDRIVGLISPTEESLSEKEKWYEGEQARIKKEKEEAEKTRIQNRLTFLLSNGFKVELLDYVLAGAKVSYNQIQKLDDEAWSSVMTNVVEPAIHNAKVELQAEAERQIKAKEEAERKAKETEDKAKELEAKEKALKESEERLKKMQDELAAKLAEVKPEQTKVEPTTEPTKTESVSDEKPIYAPIFSPSIEKQQPISDHYSDSVTVQGFITRLTLVNLEESVLTPEYKELAKSIMTNVKGLQSVLKLKLQQINAKHLPK